ncbi:MAG TPA: hypothetical protein VIC08_09065, partial [Cellvibrionaceae bacterium]
INGNASLMVVFKFNRDECEQAITQKVTDTRRLMVYKKRDDIWRVEATLNPPLEIVIDDIGSNFEGPSSVIDKHEIIGNNYFCESVTSQSRVHLTKDGKTLNVQWLYYPIGWWISLDITNTYLY